MGGHAAVVPVGGVGILGGLRNLYLFRSSPVEVLKELLPQAQIEFDPGQNPAEAALLAKRSDAEVGYRWYAKQNATPMYAFGHGLSYTT